jgi:multisubunit Na+/H+ antiporter MnhG subunit
MLPKTTIDQNRDTGLLICLIMLVISFYTHKQTLLPSAIVILLVAMLCPGCFLPLARPWFGLSHLLGTLSSKLIFTLIFFLVVTPVGLLRKAAGKDAMQLKNWKDGKNTALNERNHRYVSSDLEHPY